MASRGSDLQQTLRQTVAGLFPEEAERAPVGPDPRTQAFAHATTPGASQAAAPGPWSRGEAPVAGAAPSGYQIPTEPAQQPNPVGNGFLNLLGELPIVNAFVPSYKGGKSERINPADLTPEQRRYVDENMTPMERQLFYTDRPDVVMGTNPSLASQIYRDEVPVFGRRENVMGEEGSFDQYGNWQKIATQGDRFLQPENKNEIYVQGKIPANAPPGSAPEYSSIATIPEQRTSNVPVRNAAGKLEYSTTRGGEILEEQMILGPYEPIPGTSQEGQKVYDRSGNWNGEYQNRAEKKYSKEYMKKDDPNVYMQDIVTGEEVIAGKKNPEWGPVEYNAEFDKHVQMDPATKRLHVVADPKTFLMPTKQADVPGMGKFSVKDNQLREFSPFATGSLNEVTKTAPDVRTAVDNVNARASAVVNLGSYADDLFDVLQRDPVVASNYVAEFAAFGKNLQMNLADASVFVFGPKEKPTKVAQGAAAASEFERNVKKSEAYKEATRNSPLWGAVGGDKAVFDSIVFGFGYAVAKANDKGGRVTEADFEYALKQLATTNGDAEVIKKVVVQIMDRAYQMAEFDANHASSVAYADPNAQNTIRVNLEGAKKRLDRLKNRLAAEERQKNAANTGGGAAFMTDEEKLIWSNEMDAYVGTPDQDRMAEQIKNRIISER